MTAFFWIDVRGEGRPFSLRMDAVLEPANVAKTVYSRTDFRIPSILKKQEKENVIRYSLFCFLKQTQRPHSFTTLLWPPYAL